MTSTTARRLTCLFLPPLLVGLGCCGPDAGEGVEVWDRPEQADVGTGVALVLGPDTQVVKQGERPRFTATLVNRGDREVTLVAPGDGSDCGWRTPVLSWSRHSTEKGRFCGNVNALKPDEVFTLGPGESRALTGRLGSPHLGGPGRYRVALMYRNEPDREWVGIPLGNHNEDAMRRVRSSTPVEAVSNAVEVVVAP